MTNQPELRPGAALERAFRIWSVDFLRLHLIVIALGAPLVVITALLSIDKPWPALWASDSFLGMSAYATQVALVYSMTQALGFFDEAHALTHLLTHPGAGVGLLAVLIQYGATGAVVGRVCGEAERRGGLLQLVFRVILLGLLGTLTFVATDMLLFQLLAGISFYLALLLSWFAQLALGAFFWLSLAILVVERTGVLAALKKGMGLSKGSRIRIAALLILIALNTQAVLWLLNVLVEHQLSVAVAVRFTLGLVLPVMKGCILAAVYLQLRERKEGPPVEEVTAVFG
ncbi:MAG: hypothetical protein ACYSX0_14390 [Planctomycetota bacterium]|jgi:hypothetical protein